MKKDKSILVEYTTDTGSIESVRIKRDTFHTPLVYVYIDGLVFQLEIKDKILNIKGNKHKTLLSLDFKNLKP